MNVVFLLPIAIKLSVEFMFCHNSEVSLYSTNMRQEIIKHEKEQIVLHAGTHIHFIVYTRVGFCENIVMDYGDALAAVATSSLAMVMEMFGFGSSTICRWMAIRRSCIDILRILRQS